MDLMTLALLNKAKSGGGGDEPNPLDAYIEGNLTDITSNATSVAAKAFSGNELITSISLPQATSIGENAFQDCTSIKSVEIPQITSISNYAFKGCTSLTNFDFTKITSIGENAFRDCTSIKSVDSPNLKQVNNYTFYGCSALTSVNLPHAKSALQFAFESCSTLEKVNLPSVEVLAQYTFSACTSLKSVRFPNLLSISGNYAFYNSHALTTVDFDSTADSANLSFPRSTFGLCRSLIAVIIRQPKLCRMTQSASNVFAGCYHFHGTVNETYNPDGLKDGYIYVPSALVAEYQAATNWSEISTQFRALEDYTVDGTITGELDPTKI